MSQTVDFFEKQLAATTNPEDIEIIIEIIFEAMRIEEE